MFSSRTAVSAVIAVLVLSGISVFCPDDSSAVTVESGEYGAVSAIDYATFDNAVYYLTDKHLTQWAQEFLGSILPTYSFDLGTPVLDSKLAVTRDTHVSGNSYMIDDHLSCYLLANLDFAMTGSFPEAGTYMAQDGETLLEFINRVFVDEGTGPERTVHMIFDIKIYVDADLYSHVDLATGDITDSKIDLRFAVYDMERFDFSFDFDVDSDFNPIALTINFDQQNTDSNLYLHAAADLMFDGMNAFAGGSHEMNPKLTEHTTEFLISSDLADSLWVDLIAHSDTEIGGVNLADLILNILGSGGRTLDLFDTIKSLTSSDIPDITFIDKFQAEDYTEGGYEYCKLTAQRTSGTGPVLYLPYGPYCINGEMIQSLLPDISSEQLRIIAEAIVMAFVLNPLEVKDISEDPTTKGYCAAISQAVNVVLEAEEDDHFALPMPYVAVTVFGILFSIVLCIQLRRNVI